MNNGAFDFATKPIDLDDLQRTIDKAIEQLEFVHESQKNSRELTDLHSDLSVAKEIQHAILPQNFDLGTTRLSPTLSAGYKLMASMEAAKDVGGDFYDFFAIDEKHMGFTMADVSGKGVPASIFMAVSRTLIKATALRDIPSNECMRIANNMLCDESVNSMFVTAFYGILDLESGTIDYTNAGHNPPYILRKDGSLEIIPAVGNLVLGAFGDMPFKNGIMQLNPGDMFFTFTDGVTEAENQEHEQFGEARLEALLKEMTDKTPAEVVSRISTEVHAFAGEAAQSDDITQLAIRRC